MYRISSSYVGMLVAMLQAEGLDAVRLCREAGIDMCLLAQEDAFFTRASAYRLMALAELDSDNPNLGLRCRAFQTWQFPVGGLRDDVQCQPETGSGAFCAFSLATWQWCHSRTVS